MQRGWRPPLALARRVHLFWVTMQTANSSFIRALVDDASLSPFFSSLLGMKRQREASERLAQQERAQIRRIEPFDNAEQAEQIRERAA